MLVAVVPLHNKHIREICLCRKKNEVQVEYFLGQFFYITFHQSNF